MKRGAKYKNKKTGGIVITEGIGKLADDDKAIIIFVDEFYYFSSNHYKVMDSKKFFKEYEIIDTHEPEKFSPTWAGFLKAVVSGLLKPLTFWIPLCKNKKNMFLVILIVFILSMIMLLALCIKTYATDNPLLMTIVFIISIFSMACICISVAKYLDGEK